MSNPLIVANWKMNHTVEETIAFAMHFGREALPKNIDVVIAPPFTALYSLSVVLHERTKGSPLELAAQNCHEEERGAFTGEISAAFLKEMDCRYVILGHSERRQYFGETDEKLAKKVASVLSQKMIPLLCVGESLAEREAGATQTRIISQLEGALNQVSAADLEKIVIAYEPIWAIGTGKTATPAQAQEVHAAIRHWLGTKAGPNAAASIRILYGGSVNAKNIASLMKEPDINGALVGGASLIAKDFAELVRLAG